MKRKTYLSIVMIFISVTVNSQVEKDFFPPSPTASGLAKYIEFPVSTYTGIPSISIPIYEIEVDGIKIPISLDYHAGGIQVDEEASWVGLGWSLNAGGAIFEKTYGYPDYTGPGFMSVSNHKYYPCQDYLDNMLNTYKQLFIAPVSYAGLESTDHICDLDGALQSNEDMQPDIFLFSFLNYFGKFVATSPEDIMILDKQNIKFSYENYNAGFDNRCWTAVTPDGAKFYFAELESTWIPGSNNGFPEQTVTYYLSQIITPNGESIIFKYDYNGTIYSCPHENESLTWKSSDRHPGIITENNLGMGS